ncbi:CBS domain-containing protein [Lujinxingia vulgaris]|uniref:CBS domain-containing protein n=1 Tax=Lujinxingia vulgaris TaxID=2600176 RepID=A0A5C6X1L9_9DELT|nr:glutamate-cysteine ligase family protein [Lujinxingia vulgaris]TXD31767.1 CBS domain-containing protein [Lujinxingia vulgaris]
MGEHDVKGMVGGDQLRHFMRRLLGDVRALEKMLDEGMIESGIRRIGAEQELFLLDSSYRPAPLAMRALERINDKRFTTELAQFNLEFNLEPRVFGDDCLGKMEDDIVELVDKVRHVLAEDKGHVALAGILPTLQKSDLGLDSMTPNPRYRILNDALSRLRGGDYEFYIKGQDEFIVKHDSVMLEACNTSFQVHFQVGPEEFAKLYNVAQVVAAPVTALAANSPLLFGKRLWHETRIALLEQSIDTRPTRHHMRDLNPRVTFGTKWIDDSVLEIFREDIARFRLLFATELDEDPFEALAAGRVPGLKALCLHNGTVYRWNRPCYGISEGRPHLRIENRVLPAGPTPADEVANAAFWFGMMAGVVDAYGDMREKMNFDDARHNFFAAARHGLDAPMTWLDGKSGTVREIIESTLLPLSREALTRHGIRQQDIDRYMGIIEDRVSTRRTGASWLLQSYSELGSSLTAGEKLSALTAATVRRQEANEPVHTWPLASVQERTTWRDNYLKVSQYMTTDLITVNDGELIDLVASVMDWQHLRHVPVEDNEHRLVGLVTRRTMMRLLGSGALRDEEPVPVSQIMERNVITVTPDTLTLDAIRIMGEKRISCLPVVDGEKLVGIITERDFMDIARDLLADKLRGEEPAEAQAAE